MVSSSSTFTTQADWEPRANSTAFTVNGPPARATVVTIAPRGVRRKLAFANGCAQCGAGLWRAAFWECGGFRIGTNLAGWEEREVRDILDAGGFDTSGHDAARHPYTFSCVGVSRSVMTTCVNPPRVEYKRIVAPTIRPRSLPLLRIAELQPILQDLFHDTAEQLAGESGRTEMADEFKAVAGQLETLAAQPVVQFGGEALEEMGVVGQR